MSMKDLVLIIVILKNQLKSRGGKFQEKDTKKAYCSNTLLLTYSINLTAPIRNKHHQNFNKTIYIEFWHLEIAYHLLRGFTIKIGQKNSWALSEILLSNEGYFR